MTTLKAVISLIFPSFSNTQPDKKDDKKDKKDKKQTESYIGGEKRYLIFISSSYVKKSGLAVENPDHAEEIVRRAQE